MRSVIDSAAMNYGGYSSTRKRNRGIICHAMPCQDVDCGVRGRTTDLHKIPGDHWLAKTNKSKFLGWTRQDCPRLLQPTSLNQYIKHFVSKFWINTHNSNVQDEIMIIRRQKLIKI